MDIQRWEHGAEQKQKLVDEAEPGPITHALPMLPLVIKPHLANHARYREFFAICALPGNRFEVVFAHPVSKSGSYEVAENRQGHWHEVEDAALHLVCAATGNPQLDLAASVTTPVMRIPFDARRSLDQNMHNMVRSARLHDYDYNRLSNKQAGLFVGRDQFPDELEDFINSPVSTSARMWYFSSLSTLPWSLLDLAAFAKAHSARAGIGHACDCLFGWGVLCNSPIALIYELRNTTKDQIVFALLRELTLSFDNIPPASWPPLAADWRGAGVPTARADILYRIRAVFDFPTVETMSNACNGMHARTQMPGLQL